MDFEYADGGRVGIIASISRPFCLSCNRLRLTADGKLRNCLFAIDEVDVKGLLRSQAAEADSAEVIRRNVAAKWEGHEINTARFIKPLRTMHAIGGYLDRAGTSRKRERRFLAPRRSRFRLVN